MLLKYLEHCAYVWAPLTLQGGWTVADTARPERIITMRNSNNSCKSRIELSTPANSNRQYSSDNTSSYVPNIANIQSPKHIDKGLNDVAEQTTPNRSQLNNKSSIPHTISHQQELDKLLAGLDALSETLPDLAPRNSFGHNTSYSSTGYVDSFPNNGLRGDGIPSVLDPFILNGLSNTSVSGLDNNNKLKKYSDEIDEKNSVQPGNETITNSVISESNIKPSEIQKQLAKLTETLPDNLSNPYLNNTMQPVAVMDSQPYHTRMDSKPFSYIRTNMGGSSKASSRNISRASSKEALSHPGGIGLESPSLLRKILDVNGSSGSSNATPPRPMSPHIISSRNSPAPLSNNIKNGIDSRLQSPHILSSQTPSMSQKIPQFSAPFETGSSYGNAQNLYNFQTSTLLSPSVVPIEVKQQHRSSTNMQISSNGGIIDAPVDENRNSSNLIKHMKTTDEEASMTWLQKQQAKLKDRRENHRRRESRDRDGDMMNELRTSLNTARLNDKPLSDVGKVVDLTNMHSTTSGNISRVNHTLMMSATPNRSTTPTLLTTNISTPPHQYDYRQQKQPNNVPPTQQLISPSLLQRQKSDSSYDRQRPIFVTNRGRMRYDSESEANTSSNQQYNNGSYYQHPRTSSTTSIDSSNMFLSNSANSCNNSLPNSRPITPGFPCSAPATPYFNQSSNTLPYPSIQQQVLQRVNGIQRSASPAGGLSNYGASSTPRRGSISSTATSEQPTEVSATHVRRTKESHRYWYKPTISREEAIFMLRVMPPGSFVVRDSNSFPGAFGLALKVATLPTKSESDIDPNSEELVRHFLIEPTKKGVKLKGYANEPVFSSLSALVYQHTVTALALPTMLILPHVDIGSISSRDSIDSKMSNSASQMQQLLALGAACNVMYLFTASTDTLTGPKAIQKTVTQFLILSSSAGKESLNNKGRSGTGQTLVHFKVSSQGITLTDNARRLFFRKHYNTPTISYCGVDPDDRKWNGKDEKMQDSFKSLKHSNQKSRSPSMALKGGARIFGFVARKPTSRSGHNQCHIFAEQDPDQPAKAIVNFVNKVLSSCLPENASTDRVKNSDVV